MGQKCGLTMGPPNRQLLPPNLDLRHIQDHFGFTFPRVALTRFSRGFSLPVVEPSACARSFSSSAGSLLLRFQHGSKTWVRLIFLSPGRIFIPPTGVSDCTIAFRNCKSFLPKRNCRRTASTYTTQRQLTIRSTQIKEFPLTVGKLGRIHRIPCKGIRARIGEGEIHLCRLGGAKILIGAGVLYCVKGIAEHLVVGFLPVQ